MHRMTEPVRKQTERSDDEQTRAERRRRNDELIRTIDEWLADESGYDEETWPWLEAALQADHPSSRKLFRD